MLKYNYVGCIEQIRLRAVTGTVVYAESDSPHRLVFEIKRAANKSVAIPCDYTKCKEGVTTRFDYDIEEFYSGESVPCVKPEDITAAAIVEGGDEGWYIASIYTTFIACNSAGTITADEDFNKWVDGNELPSQTYQSLTLV